MGWIERKLESGARRYTLNRTLTSVVIWSAYGTVGVFQLVKFFGAHDTFYLYAGLFNLLIGIFMVWFSLRMTHAVVRRKISQAIAPPPEL